MIPLCVSKVYITNMYNYILYIELNANNISVKSSIANIKVSLKKANNSKKKEMKCLKHVETLN